MLEQGGEVAVIVVAFENNLTGADLVAQRGDGIHRGGGAVMDGRLVQVGRSRQSRRGEQRRAQDGGKEESSHRGPRKR